MKIYADKLADSLSKQLYGCYLLFGNEPLLLHESKAAIEHSAKQQGYDETHRFNVDANLDWNDVLDCCHAMSLFSSRQIIELDLPESGLNATITKALQSVADALNPDIILIVTGQKITRAQENAAWCKALLANGCLVNCLTPDIHRLPQFIAARCRSLNLTPDRDALQMLAQWHEGNLLALAQSLEKLALNYPDGTLNLARLEDSLSRHNHYTPFHWSDALLEGKAQRAQRILAQLQSEGAEPIILLRTLQKELLQLIKMQHATTQQPLSAVMESFRVWNNKRPLYSAALQRLSTQKLRHLVKLLAQCEILTKTQYEQPVWPQLQQISLECCLPHVNIPS
ncbi:DNA polymerase III subunit delta [Vibrio palustris]|uniref:DNA polymerase III subunit delta n=1 Tax=Vibrio palustris TaxID=1918946 RepID=A0A1R4B1A3_9VIBR|nr:DNA polymerase III subunit delta [Vibrio palustris]SJL82698.1 DNA polymerase III subunit delta [Vibrio palustris]